MAHARKLFPIYGSALANRLISAIERDRVVARFVAGYVSEYGRRGILGGPARDREFDETIGREILLSAIVEVHAALPLFFGRKQISKLQPEEADAIESFFRELIGAWAQARNWNGEDRREFRRDLRFYAEFEARQKAVSSRKQAKAPEEESPFVARVALLLDPSLLEQARSAARKFHPSVRKLARNLLHRTLHAGRR